MFEVAIGVSKMSVRSVTGSAAVVRVRIVEICPTLEGSYQYEQKGFNSIRHLASL
jgi:hypothetical protein